MSKTLLENTFMIANLRELTGAAKAAPGKHDADADPKATAQPTADDGANNTPDSETNDASEVTDWEYELKRRHAENNKLTPDAKLDPSDVEKGFWIDFFTSLYKDEKLANNLYLLNGLRADIKILGYELKSNPILAFFGIKHVQTNLLSVMSNEKYMAVVHNSVQKEYVSDLELEKANDYNIIYCKNLYTKSVGDITKYLEAQRQSLKPNIRSYSAERCKDNKIIFLKNAELSVLDEAAELNPLETVQKRLGMVRNDTKKPGNGDNKSTTDSAVKDTGDVAKPKTPTETATPRVLEKSFYSTPELAFATLQYLGLTKNNEKAMKMLGALNFSNVTTENVIEATKTIRTNLKTTPLSDEVTTAVLRYINDKYKQG